MATNPAAPVLACPLFMKQNPFLQKANVTGPLNINYVSANYTKLSFYLIS